MTVDKVGEFIVRVQVPTYLPCLAFVCSVRYSFEYGFFVGSAE